MIKKIIITGATGYIGSNLVRRLVKEEYKVFLIVRENSDLSIIDDILDEVNILRYNGKMKELISLFKEIEQIDLVIHLASLFIVQHNQEQIDELIDSNIKFGTQILEAMVHSKCSRIINTGSYWQHYNNEDYNPVCLYAATKEAFEKIIQYYYEVEKINCITLELFDTYGETDPRRKITSLLKECAEKNIHLDMSPGEQVINLVYIDDVVEAYLKAIDMIDKEKRINNKYSVCNTEEVTLKELVGIYEKIYNKELNINFGGRPYREREVMRPWNKGKILDGWYTKLKLEERISESINRD